MSNGKSKKEEYNPIQGDILSFLNEATKPSKEVHAEVAPKPISKKSYKGMGLSSEEAFPALGAGIPSAPPVWGAGPVGAVHRAPQNISQTFELAVEQQKPLKADSRDRTPRSVAQICQEIASRTRTSIDASTSSKTRSMAFIITGRAADVAEAKRQLWAELAQSATATCEVPEEHLGAIIGQGGRNVQSIMAETGTRINVPRKGEESTGQSVLTITITGDLDGVHEAKARIMAIVNERARKVVERCEVPAHLLPFIYGVTSAHVAGQAQAWSERHSVKVSQDVDRETDRAVVTISGDRDEVRVAHGEFLRLTEEQRRSVKSVSTAVPKALHRFLIGPKGSVLHDLESETGCMLAIPAPEQASEQVTIYGPQERLFKGLSAVMEKTGTMASETVRLAPSLRSLVLERFRAQLNELQATHDGLIQPSNDGLQVSGLKSNMPGLLTGLDQILKPLNGWVFDTSLVVDPKYFKHIIGKKGLKLKEIEASCGAQVIVPSSDDGEEALLIAGPTKAAVSNARAQLEDLVEALADFASAAVRVEAKYQRLLAGKGRSNLNKHTDAHPSIFIVFEDDSAIIKGRKAEVAAVQAAIQSEIDALRHEMVMEAYTLSIPLSLEQARLAVNGKRPANWAQRLATEHDVKLSAESNQLVIQGLKRLAEEARDALLEHLHRLENTGSVVVELPHALHAQLIGKGHKNVKHLERKYGVQLAFPDAQDTGNDRITVTGPKSSLSAAKAELVSFHEHLAERQHRVQFNVPTPAVARIVGRGGETVDALRLDTDTSIDIDKKGQESEDAAETTQITIQGTEKGIKQAHDRILAIVKEWESETTESIALTPAQHTALSTGGPASQAFRRLVDSQHQGLTILLQAQRILVRGEKTRVPAAAKALESFLATSQAYKTVEMTIPSRCHGEIIGAGGENIRRLSHELSVRIDIPRGGGANKDTIRISGLPDDLEKARAALQTYVREERTFPAASRPLRDSLMATLSQSHPHLRVVPLRDGLHLHGSPADLDAAMAALTLAAADQRTDSIEVPKAQHGLLMGPGGATVKAIREASGGCHLDLPARDDPSTTVRLSGTAEAIAKAKLEIDRLLAN